MALRHVFASAKGLQITLMGQSLGGSILAGLISREEFNGFYNNVVFSTPALGQLNHRLSDEEIQLRINDTSNTFYDVNLPFEKYSTINKYLDFMKTDTKAINKITARSRKAFLAIENMYFTKKNILTLPSLFIYPEKDEIIDIEVARKIYNDLCTDKLLLQVPSKSHYLEFSTERARVLYFISAFINCNLEKFS